jgi:RHS repeat-associated protein
MDFSFDNADRLTGETWRNAGGTLVNTQTFTLDSNSNLLTAADANGAYTFSYDALDRVSTQAGPFGLSLTFGYDAVGNRTLEQDSKGGVLTSLYDGDNQLTSRQLGGSGITPLRFDTAYTARNQVGTLTRYSDLAGTTKIGESDSTYDNAGRLTNLQIKDGSGTILGNYTTTYDLASRATSETIDGTTTSFGYDALSQLTSAGASNYGYDLGGNRNASGYTVGSDNHMTSDGLNSYSYDAEGNRTKKVNSSTGETWTSGYDNNNQMTWAEDRATDGGTLLLRLDEKYDAFGRRIEEDRWTQATGTVVTHFGYDDSRAVWADLDSNNTLLTRYVHSDESNTPVAKETGGGSVGWYGTDREGSVRLNLSASGAVLNRNAYDAYGQQTSQSSPSNGDRFAYTGAELQPDVGLQLHDLRWYDPKTGRWTSEDPLGFAAGDANVNRYVGNGPTNATDPSGLAAAGAGFNPDQALPRLAPVPLAAQPDVPHAEMWQAPSAGASGSGLGAGTGDSLLTHLLPLPTPPPAAPAPLRITLDDLLQALFPRRDPNPDPPSAAASAGTDLQQLHAFSEAGRRPRAETIPLDASLAYDPKDQIVVWGDRGPSEPPHNYDRINALFDKYVQEAAQNTWIERRYDPERKSLAETLKELYETLEQLDALDPNSRDVDVLLLKILKLRKDLGQLLPVALAAGEPMPVPPGPDKPTAAELEQAAQAAQNQAYQQLAMAGGPAALGPPPTPHPPEEGRGKELGGGLPSDFWLDKVTRKIKKGVQVVLRVRKAVEDALLETVYRFVDVGQAGVWWFRSKVLGQQNVPEPKWRSEFAQNVPPYWDKEATKKYFWKAQWENVQDNLLTLGLGKAFKAAKAGWKAAKVGLKALKALADRKLGKLIHGTLGKTRLHDPLAKAARALGFKVCFAARTPLLAADGTARPIEQFRVGDGILARPEHDPSAPVAAQVVEEVFVRTGRLWHLHVGGQVIRTTGEHPFWVQGKGWTPARELRTGDRLSSHDGGWLAVEEVLDTGDYETVYNLRVSHYHTYFVGALDWGFSVWAHNSYVSDVKGKLFENLVINRLRNQGHVVVFRNFRRGGLDLVTIRNGSVYIHEIKYGIKALQKSKFTATTTFMRTNVTEVLSRLRGNVNLSRADKALVQRTLGQYLTGPKPNNLRVQITHFGGKVKLGPKLRKVLEALSGGLPIDFVKF